MERVQSYAGNREAVAMFDDAASLQQAIDDLMSSGFDRADLSLLASAGTVEAKLGHHYEQVRDLEDDASVPRTVYVARESVGDAEGALVGALVYVGATAVAGAVVASGGALALAIAGATLAGGAAAFIGSALAIWLGDSQARKVQEQLERGGLLLWVRTRDAEHEDRAVKILLKHSGDDVHVHGVPHEVTANRTRTGTATLNSGA